MSANKHNAQCPACKRGLTITTEGPLLANFPQATVATVIFPKPAVCECGRRWTPVATNAVFDYTSLVEVKEDSGLVTPPSGIVQPC